MKLEAINIGLRTAAACALILGGCDSGNDDGGNDATAASAATGDDGDDGDDDGDDDDGDDDGGTSGGVEDTGSESGSVPTGMGEDPPTFDCANATQTLDDTYFIIDEGTEFDDIDSLEGINVINGDVDINRTNYNNLDFLNCVTEITGTLTIFGNDFLVDASALDNLTVLGGDFIFTNNNAITVFNGMNNVEEVSRSPNPECEEPGVVCGGNGPPVELFHSVVMNKNEVMDRIEGWDSLKFIFGNITVRDNPTLTNIDGFKGLLGIGSTLAIAHNPELCYESINCVGAGIVNPAPADVPDTWTTQANSPDC
ncbi:MAG: hypothetical protein JKY37_07765 [Nannocystaceae bacterium]|nr:hypothetical protein [Nannocystaceae bacterium]